MKPPMVTASRYVMGKYEDLKMEGIIIVRCSSFVACPLTTDSCRSSPARGGAPPVGWWRGTGGVLRRRSRRIHLACPTTMPRMVPLPHGDRSSAHPPKTATNRADHFRTAPTENHQHN